MPLEGLFSFDRFQLDLSTGRLSGGSGPIPLAPKALAVLEYLAARPGQLISKDELLAAVWPGVFLGDGALKVCVSELRRALDDDARKPRIIETAHRRGYRFIAEVVGTSPKPAPPAGPSTSPPRLPVQYARSGDLNIAYQVLGSGPIDLVFVMGWVSHLECFWTEPSFARFLRRLARFSRLILFDKRGTGLSDRTCGLPSLEERMEDVRAVLNAVGSRRAALLGVSEGGPMCSLFAATYPEKTEALVMIGTYARRQRAADYPWGPTPEEHEAFCRDILERWGGPVGIETRARPGEGKRLIPAEAHGLRVMSMGMFLNTTTPVIWRGPMVSKLVTEFLRNVEWGELEVLVVDLPPGTGDVALSMAQSVPMAGAVVVTTPQGVSVSDVRKAVGMFRQLNIPLLGVIENMSYFVCGHCQERTEIFGNGGGRRMAEEMSIPFLGEVPIDTRVRSGGDEGSPIVAAVPDAPAAQAFEAVASQVAAQVSIQNMRVLRVIQTA